MTGFRSTVKRHDLSQERIEAALAGTALGHPCRFFERTDSTNNAALEWARLGAPHGALVVADAQSAGRGRWGRRWEGAEGASILASFVLHLRIPGPSMGLAGGALAFASASAARAVTGLAVQTKWPNDLWLHGRKCGGLLVESFHRDRSICDVVAGIGINVNQGAEDLPRSPRVAATSLSLEAGHTWDRAELLAGLTEAIAEALELAERHPDRLLAEWSAVELTLGRAIEAVGEGRVARGVAVGLLPDAGLRLRADDSERVLRWGEVTLTPLTALSGLDRGDES